MLLGLIAVITAEYTARVWVPASREGTIIPTVFDTAAVLLNGETRVYWGCFGLTLGLLLTWISDEVNRPKTVGPAVVLLTAGHTLGILTPTVLAPAAGTATVGTTALSVVWFGFALAVGLQAGGIPLVQRFTPFFDTEQLFKPRPPYHFPLVAGTTIVVLVVAVAIGLIDLHLFVESSRVGGVFNEPRRAGTNVVLGLFLILSIRPFTTATSELRVVQLGPARAGKSAMLGGLGTQLEKEGRLFTGEGDVSETFETVKRKLDRGEWPPKTRREEVNVLRFSYRSSNPVFRTKTTISAIDHGGELLTGTDTPLSEYVEGEIAGARLRSRSGLIDRLITRLRRIIDRYDPRTDWEDTIKELETREEIQTDEVLPKLAKLVVNADMLVFTLPMDDYLHDYVRNEWGLPSHVSVTVFKKRDDGEFDVTGPQGEPVSRKGTQVETLRKGDTGYHYYDADQNEVAAADFEKPSVLPQLDSNPARYYVVNQKAVRELPGAYTSVYRELVRKFERRRTKQFTWVVTKADLALDEFERRTDNRVPFGRDYSVEDLIGGNVPAGDATVVMKTFSTWIRRTAVEREFPQLTSDELLESTRQEFIYPVWFSVDEATDGPKPKADGDFLYGANYLINRYDRRELIGTPADSTDGRTQTVAQNAYERIKSRERQTETGAESSQRHGSADSTDRSSTDPSIAED